MNLQPRKVAELPTSEEAAVYFAEKELRSRKRRIPSIWRMELPNTSYSAPVSAFWWVSNERRG